MNIKSEFLKPENVYLIWELLSEQNIIKNQQSQVKEQISNYVVNQIHNYYNNNLKGYEKHHNFTLIQMNKEYIKFIIYYVKNNYPNQINKIKIHEEPVTFKDIQDQRELEFNTKFNEMQTDFTNTVTLNKPEMPQFEDNVGDKPVSVNDMEELIKEMTMKRNYDLQTVEANNEKTVSFENEKKEKSVTDDFHNFFDNLDTYEEPNFNSYNDTKTNIFDNNTNNINTNNNTENTNNITMNIVNTDTDIDTDTTNPILNLQKQVHFMQNKIDSLETKLDLLLNKI